MKIWFVILSLLGASALSSQNISLREDTQQLITDECRICYVDKGLKSKIVDPSYHSDMQQLYFHNFHVNIISGHTSKALEIIHLIESEKDAPHELIVYLKGCLFLQKDLLEVAEVHFENSLYSDLHEVIKANSRLNLALISQERGDFQKALYQLEKAEEIYNRVGHDYNLKAVYKNFALCYLHSERYVESRAYYIKAIELEKNMQDTLGLATSYMDLANLYYVQYKDELAIPLFQKGLAYAEKSENLNVQRTANLNMSVVEENRGELGKALAYRKKFEQLVDSIWNRDQIWELAEHEKKFVLAQKQKEIILLEKEKKIKEVQRSYFLWLLVLVTLFSVHLFIAYRRRLRQNKIVMRQKQELDRLNQMKDRMFSIVAHDLRSPLNSLKTIHLKLDAAILTKDWEEAKRLSRLSQRAIRQVYLLLDNVLHWAMSQLQRLLFNRQMTNLNAVVSSVCDNYEGVFEIHNQKLRKEIPEHIFLNIDHGTFKIVLRNLIDNAVKYNNDNGTVSISAELVGDECVLNVQDDGVGVSPLWISEFSNSVQNPDGRLGLSLVKLFVEKNNGKISVENKQTQGTIFKVRLPVTKFI